MKKLTIYIAIFGLGVLPMSALAGITLEGYRGENSLGFGPEDKEDRTVIYINQQDCKDNIIVNLLIEETGEAEGDLVIVWGENCDRDSDENDGSPMECSTNDDIKLAGTTEIDVRKLLKAETETCSGEGDIKVWVARMEDKSEHTNGDVWSNSITIDYDMDPPDPPEDIELGLGNKKIMVYWNGDDEDAGTGEAFDDEVDLAYVLYEKVDGSDDSTPAEDESDSDIFAFTETDVADAGVDLDAGASTAVSPLARTLAATEESDCESSTFKAGAPYTDQFKNKKEASPRSGEQEIGGLENGEKYRFAVVALDEHRNPSVLSEVRCTTPNKTDNFLQQYLDDGGKVGNYCFIATAAFGSYDHPVVQALRVFRDRFLAEIPGGDVMIAAYYEVGPDLATLVTDHPVLKKSVQVALAVTAGIALPLGMLGPFGLILLSLALLSGGLFLSRRRRK